MKRMASKWLGGMTLAALLIGASPVAHSGPVLEETSPTPTVFTYLTDYLQMTGTNFGDVTARLFAVDLVLPPGPVPSSDTSGCEAADFAGFTAGSIALMQRGTCTFAQKVANAQAAGAAGVLIFNEGQPPDRIDVLAGTLAPFTANVIVFGTSFAVGNELSNGVLNGPTGLTVHMNLAVPEPATLALLGVGLAGLGFSRRKQ